VKKALIIALGLVLVLPMGILAQDGSNVGQFKVEGFRDVENKPKAFYYDLDPYLPIGVLLGKSQFILDDNLITQVEKSIGRSTFMADPNLLRKPVNVSEVYDLDNDVLSVDVSRYQEKGISEWQIQILDARGNTFRTLSGSGGLPAIINWDGRGENPSDVMFVGDVYSFIVLLTTKDGSNMRKIGRPIDVNGIAYDNVVAFKESEAATYEVDISQKIANYYQYVLNRFKEKGFAKISITASDFYVANQAKEYLSERLMNIQIDVQENPEYSRIEFVFN
jgi:hypothetical protein